MMTVLAAMTLAAQPVPPTSPPTPPAPPQTIEYAEKVEVVRIRERGPDGEMVEREATPEEVANIRKQTADCPTRAFTAQTEIKSGDETRMTRVVLCAENDDPATYRKILNSAREAIGVNGQLTIAGKADLIAKIDAELETLDTQ